MRVLLTIIIVLLFDNIGYSQMDTGYTIYSRLDTVETTNVGLRSETGPKYARYYVNEKLVDKRTYDNFQYLFDNISKCKPCFLKVYDADERLVRTAEQYIDCPIGSWTEFYPNGKVKLEGQFKRNGKAKWEEQDYRLLCAIKDGKWKYYDEIGNLIKVETYKEGKLLE
ncbi:MAG: toxin-antitoxin system YwqK family antitoxin [Flavisolibacter sp.]